MLFKRRTNYAFIDGANLHFGIKAQGLRIDYKKFRLHLKDEHDVGKAFVFIGWVEDNQQLYENLRKDGFELVFKPVISYLEKGELTHKGNVDAELVLQAAAIEYKNYNQAVIVTSDGDFACLMKFLLEKDKLKQIIAPTGKYSSLLSQYRDHIVLIKNIRPTICDTTRRRSRKKRASNSGRPKPQA